MSVSTHLNVLQEKCHDLSHRIHDAYAHHQNDVELASLKKKRLQLEDEILRLQQLLNA